MKDQIDKLHEFHLAFGHPIETMPTIASKFYQELRYKLAKEELDEFVDACDKEDVVAVADSLVDQLYVLLGTAHVFGLSSILDKCFDEIHRSNMSKLGEDGRPILRDDGKVLKGPLYSPPNLEGFVMDAVTQFKTL